MNPILLFSTWNRKKIKKQVRHFVSFENFNPKVSELIHLVRCVKFNPYFIPGIVLIVFCGRQSNRRTNFIPRLAGFNLRLALIVFSGTGAWFLFCTASLFETVVSIYGIWNYPLRYEQNHLTMTPRYQL